MAFAPNPRVIYPVSPVNAVIAVVEAEVGRGILISVAVIVGIENMANSVAVYAKQAVSLSRKTMDRAECGKGAS